MDRILKIDIPIKFDLENSWLNGEQYSHILRNMDEYCRVFGAEKFDSKTHPASIYTEPKSKSAQCLFPHFIYVQMAQFILSKARILHKSLGSRGWVSKRNINGTYIRNAPDFISFSNTP